MIIKISLSLGLSILLIGCCSNPVSWPWHDSKKTSFFKKPILRTIPLCEGTQGESIACKQHHAVDNLRKALKYCRDMYQNYENVIDQKSYLDNSVGMMGAASALTIPTTSGTAVSILSGLSGASNIFQNRTNNFFSASASTATMNVLYNPNHG